VSYPQAKQCANVLTAATSGHTETIRPRRPLFCVKRTVFPAEGMSQKIPTGGEQPASSRNFCLTASVPDGLTPRRRQGCRLPRNGYPDDDEDGIARKARH